MFSLFTGTIFPAMGKISGLIAAFANMKYWQFWCLFDKAEVGYDAFEFENIYTGVIESIYTTNWFNGLIDGLMSSISIAMRTFGSWLGVDMLPAWVGMIVVGVVVGLLSAVVSKIVGIFT